MNTLFRIRNIAAVAMLSGALVAPALAQARPDAKIHFSGGSVAFIAGVSWGKGTLTFKGHTYPLQVRGLSVGSVGASSYQADGNVYHLKKVSDIEGTYSAVEASATAGASGAGQISLKNGAGVQIDASASSSGLKLTLAPSGVEIKLKK